MNIESANLPSLVTSSGTVDSMSQPLTDGSVISEGFSGALVTQIELLSNINTGNLSPLPTPDIVGLPSINGSQGVAALPVGKVDMQDVAALLGNDLPPSYKIKDDVDHEAVLVAVTDTLKYIGMGTAAEKAAMAEQNIKDVIAMAVPTGQNIKDATAMAVPTGQNIKDATALVVPAGQNSKDVTATVVPAVQNSKDVIAPVVPAQQNSNDVMATAVPAQQNSNDVIAKSVPAQQNSNDVMATTVPVQQNSSDVIATAVPARKNVKDVVATAVPSKQSPTDVGAEAEQGVKGVIVTAVTIQMDLKQANDKSDKKQVEGDAQIAGVEDNHVTEGVSAAIILPVVMPAEQGKIANNLAPADIIKEDGLLSFIKPSIGDAKPNQLAKVPDGVLQSEAVFRQPIQGNLNVNLKSFENIGNTGQTEKTERVEQQVLSLEGEKALPRVGTDITQPNRSVVDNKADVPAITKPLSHPEWNKDLGERIVWMSSKAIPTAEIRLNPQHLGPISVRVDVADDQATVVFTAQHAATREALEASIPKLREMMGAQQLNLVDVNVSQGSASDQGRPQSQNFAQTADGRRQSAASLAVDGVDDVEQEIESGRAVVSKGLLSIYA